ncbi:MAG: M1 family aminopeptidase [Chloroherpetonaceae bacterium]|nr:M1 family aminopeptidase [Chloroherpetonaceae bacterium]
MKTVLFFFCLSLFSVVAHAQVLDDLDAPREAELKAFERRVTIPALHPTVQPFGSRLQSRPIDILKYDLDILLPMNSGFTGSNRITFRVQRDSINRISLNANQMTIQSVVWRRDTLEVPLAYSRSDSLYVNFPQWLYFGDTVSIAIRYQVLSPSYGYYFYTSSQTGGGAGALAYTMSQPFDARYWMPCFDESFDKATMEMKVTVPQGVVVAGNGLLVNLTTNSNGTRTYHWKTDYPIATYLMCFAASNYQPFNTYYVRPNGDTLVTENYVWASDMPVAQQWNSLLPAMLAMCENRFQIPYPFEKYGQAAVRPFAYGGMEHQTMSILHRSSLSSQNLIIHELAHQWWGDMVTYESIADLWLNEGFATYSEALWREHQQGFTGLYNYMQSRLRPSQWTNSVYNPPPPYFIDEVYGKGAWVLHQLRFLCGDSLFFQILKVYGERFKYGVTNTTLFKAVAESLYGGSLHDFFQQWVYGTGAPRFHVVWSRIQDGAQWRASVRIQQTQAGQTFKTPLELFFQFPNGSTRIERVNVQNRDSLYVFFFNERPTSLEVDKNGWVLRFAVTLAYNPRLSFERYQFRLWQNYPNPFNPTTTIDYEVGRTAPVDLSVYDALGRKVATLVNQVQSPGAYSVQLDAARYGLSSGVYFYRLNAGEFSETKKLILAK